jgi:hypothetical protein
MGRGVGDAIRKLPKVESCNSKREWLVYNELQKGG